MEVDDNEEDDHGGKEVPEVGEVLAVEGLLKRTHLVVASDEHVEERNDSALELRAEARVDGGGAEGLPHDRLADVGGNEEGDARAKPVALLQELVLLIVVRA